MGGSLTSVFICIGAVWLTQRLLTISQTLRFRKQLLALRKEGRMSVGMSKAFARRVYVGLAFDNNGTVTAALVLRGVTVFAKGQPQPLLNGCHTTDLAAGRTPDGLPPLVAKATVQAAEFMAASRRRESAKAAAATAAATKECAATTATTTKSFDLMPVAVA